MINIYARTSSSGKDDNRILVLCIKLLGLSFSVSITWHFSFFFGVDFLVFVVFTQFLMLLVFTARHYNENLL